MTYSSLLLATSARLVWFHVRKHKGASFTATRVAFVAYFVFLLAVVYAWYEILLENPALFLLISLARYSAAMMSIRNKKILRKRKIAFIVVFLLTILWNIGINLAFWFKEHK